MSQPNTPAAKTTLDQSTANDLAASAGAFRDALRAAEFQIGRCDLAVDFVVLSVLCHIQALTDTPTILGDPPEGLYEKFVVTRTDGRSAEGEKHHQCRYFVIDLTHDLAAPAALRAYADVVEGRHPSFAADLRKEAGQREGPRESVEWMPDEPVGERDAPGLVDEAASALDALAAMVDPDAEPLRLKLRGLAKSLRQLPHPVDRGALVELHDDLKARLLGDAADDDDADKVYAEWDRADRETIARLGSALGLKGEDAIADPPTDVDRVAPRSQILREVETMINDMRLAEPTDVEPAIVLLVRATYREILDGVAKLDGRAGAALSPEGEG